MSSRATHRWLKKPCSVNLHGVLCLFLSVIGIFSGNCADPVFTSAAYFNDSRCKAGGVCATDPLRFTCQLKEVALLRVVLPTGHHESVSIGDTAADVKLPFGFTAEDLDIDDGENSVRNISLTLSVVNASLLACGEIKCDNDNRGKNLIVVMARCPSQDDNGDNGDDSDDGGNDGGSRNFIGVMSGIVGGGIFIAIISGGTCMLVILLVKKTRTGPNDVGRSSLSSVIKEKPVDESSQINYTYNNPIVDVPHSSQLEAASPVVKTSYAKCGNRDPTYSTIPDLPSPTDHTSQSCSAKDGTHAGDPRYAYQVPNAIIRTPHPITGVVYTDIKKRGETLVNLDAGSMYRQEHQTASQKVMKGENDVGSVEDTQLVHSFPKWEQKLPNYPSSTAPTS